MTGLLQCEWRELIVVGNMDEEPSKQILWHTEMAADVPFSHNASVLNPGPRDPPLCTFGISLLFNTPDSDPKFMRSANVLTILRLPLSLDSAHCSLLLHT